MNGFIHHGSHCLVTFVSHISSFGSGLQSRKDKNFQTIYFSNNALNIFQFQRLTNSRQSALVFFCSSVFSWDRAISLSIVECLTNKMWKNMRTLQTYFKSDKEKVVEFSIFDFHSDEVGGWLKILTRFGRSPRGQNQTRKS